MLHSWASWCLETIWETNIGAKMPGELLMVFAMPTKVPPNVGLMSTLANLYPTVETPHIARAKVNRKTERGAFSPAKQTRHRQIAAPTNPRSSSKFIFTKGQRQLLITNRVERLSEKCE